MGTLKSTFRKLTIRAVMFLLYLFIGAGIFLAIEKNAVSQKLKEQRWLNVTLQFRIAHNITEEEFRKLEEEMKQAVKDNVTLSWSYVNAFLFCYNVITTIGYGHITPKTTGGRLVMIVYALVGIPLTGYCLRCVGSEMTTFFGYLIRYFERRVFNREAEKIEIKCVYLSSGLAVVMIIMGGLLFTTTEKKRTLIDGIYFSFVTLTTIGFGDMVHESSHSMNDDLTKLTVEIFLLLYYVIGLSIMSSVIVSISAVIEDKTKKLDDPMEAIRNLRIENLNSKAMKKLGYKVDESYGINNGIMDEKRRGTIVPADDPPFPNGKISRQSRVLSSNYLNLIRNAACNNRSPSQNAHAMNTSAKNSHGNYHNNNNNSSYNNNKSGNNDGNKHGSNVRSHNIDDKNDNKDGTGVANVPYNNRNTSVVMNQRKLRQNSTTNETKSSTCDHQLTSPIKSDLGIINPEYQSSNPNSPRDDTKQFFSAATKKENDDDEDNESTEMSSVITDYDGIELDSTSDESKTTTIFDDNNVTNSSKSVYINMETAITSNNNGRCSTDHDFRHTPPISSTPNVNHVVSSRETTSLDSSGLVDVSSNVELISIQKYSSNLHANHNKNNDSVTSILPTTTTSENIFKNDNSNKYQKNKTNFENKIISNQNTSTKNNNNEESLREKELGTKFYKLSHSPNRLTRNHTNSSYFEIRPNSRKTLKQTSPKSSGSSPSSNIEKYDNAHVT